MTPPAWDVAVSPMSALGTTGYPFYWVSVRDRAMRQSSSTVGKQYELDQAQTGEALLVLDNRDAAFSPVNTSSPYNPDITSFRQVRWRAQYPATVNMLNPDQATMGDASGLAAGTLATAFGMGSSVDSLCDVVMPAAPWQGTRVLQASIPGSTSAGTPLVYALQLTMFPAKSHAYTCHVSIPSGSVSPTMHAALVWVNSAGGTLSVTGGSASVITGGSATWTALTVVGTPPAGAFGFYPAIILDSTSGAFILQTDGWQIELNTASTTWVQPGTWHSVFTGGAERWPQVYDMNGTYGKTKPTIVDAFGVLAQVYPLPPFYQDVLALGPDWFFPLNDPSGSTVFADLTGKHNPAKIANSPQGAGQISAGSGVQAAIATGTFIGATQSVVSMNNPNVGTSVGFTTCSCIELDSAGVAGPPASGGWTRMIAFNNNGGGTTTGALWDASNPSFAGGGQNFFYIAFGPSSGAPGIVFEMTSSTAGSVWSPASGSYADGNWHLMHITLSADGKTVSIYIDTVLVYTNTTTTSQNPTGIAAENIGAIVYPGLNQFYAGYNGDVAHVAQFPFPLSTTQIGVLYESWKVAWQGDSSGTRYARILQYAGYQGVTGLQGGATTSMGPAKDIDGVTSALTLLENVVTTEGGIHYVDGGGTIRLEARTNRYNQLTPSWTFGENTSAGEWPYEDVALDFDPTRVIGQAQITQYNTGQLFVANSLTTLAPNYRPTYQRTINVTNPQECVDAANYYANRYSSPQLRVQTIRLHPAGAAGLWPVALSLGISTRVRVMRRAPGQPTIQFDGFIENLKWQVDWDSGDAVLDLQISPADIQIYWVLSALHTTLKNAATAGTNTITCNPLPDSASNPAAASFCSGLAITLDPGLSTQESLTVAAAGFSATSPGYTSFTITFTSNLVFNHTSNSVVCEQLQTGQTNPAAWDASSILGTTTTLAY